MSRIFESAEKEIFNKRIKTINNTERTVWECIDRPIKPLVFELSRIGMIPKFSCCGYTYQDEEEPKTHHAKNAYVFFYAPLEHKQNFLKLTMLCKAIKWELRFFNSHTWNMFTGNPVPDDLYHKDDGLAEAIHQYEGYGLKIDLMALNIQERFETVNDPVTIVDGNSFYKNQKSWMVKPKKEFTISVEDYYKHYGKLNKEGYFKTAEDTLGMKLIDPSLDDIETIYR
ncbi:MAG: hypothetical protein ACOC2U_02815 [bacterium]